MGMKILKRFDEYGAGSTIPQREVLPKPVVEDQLDDFEPGEDDIDPDDIEEDEEPLEEVTDAAGNYVSQKIAVLQEEGYDQNQATAIAYALAKKRGFKPTK